MIVPFSSAARQPQEFNDSQDLLLSLADAVIGALDAFRTGLELGEEFQPDDVEAARVRLERGIQQAVDVLPKPPHPVTIKVNDVVADRRLHFKVRLSSLDFEEDAIELTDIYTLEIEVPN